MHNQIGFNRLGRKASHRRSLHRNMVTSLFKHEQIKTTKAKAREIRRTAEKLVTRARIDTVHNRRIIARTILQKDILNKLFTMIAPRFVDRQGGYTRMLKIGTRNGDAAEMVILQLIKDDKQDVDNRKTARGKAQKKKQSGKTDNSRQLKSSSGKTEPKSIKPDDSPAVADETSEEKSDNKIEN